MDKTERKKVAEQHYQTMEKLYEKEIEESVKFSKVFTGTIIADKDKTAFTIKIIDCDTITAALDNPGSAVLNFASYKNPGGGFIRGTMAQEEAICHESTLYNVLSRKEDFYIWNRNNLNNSLYQDRILWTPNIILKRNGTLGCCDVITCAAPNWAAAQKNGVKREDNMQALRSRIRNIINVAAVYNEKSLILGAYGCGVFGQDAEEVAKIFEEEVGTASMIPRIIFAIPSGNGNYEKFMKVFC